MANYLVDVEPNPDRVDGCRCYAAVMAGTPVPTAYPGRVGGSVLKELMARRAGGGTTGALVPTLPAGLAWGGMSGKGIPTGNTTPIDEDAIYSLTCIEPTSTDANPWPTIQAIAAALITLAGP